MRARFLGWTVAVALLMAGAGCGAGFEMRTPGGFVELDEDGYDYRSTSSDGVVIAVRALDNDPRGDLEFWSGAVDAKLRQRFTAESVRSVESRDGLPGVQIRYEALRGGRVHRYWVSIFVDEDTVYLVEAGGDAELFDAQQEAVEGSLAAFEAS